MPDLNEGVSSPEVKKFQKNINIFMDQTVMPENGSFDQDTTKGLKSFQKKMGIPQTGELDKATKAAMDKCLEQRCKITYGGRTYFLNKVEYAAVEAKACAALKKPAAAYQKMAVDMAGLWKANDDARKNNKVFAWIVDGATGAEFPSKKKISEAQAAADAMVKAAASGNLPAAQAALEKNDKIRQAVADMSQYQDEVFGGGEQLIKNLETIRDGCVVTLQVSAAIATGGASWQIQVGVAGAVGAYDGLLGEIDKAGKGDAVSVGSALGNVILAAATEAGVGWIMKGPKKELVEAVAKSAAKKVAGSGLKKAGSEAIEKFAIDVLSDGAKSAFENLIKDLVKACNPSDKMTFDQAVDNIAKNFAKGAIFKSLDAEITKYGQNLFKFIKPEDFKGLGKIDMNEAMKAGGSKVVEAAYDKNVPAAVNASKGDPAKVKSELTKLIVKDPSVQKWFKDYAKKQGKKKK